MEAGQMINTIVARYNGLVVSIPDWLKKYGAESIQKHVVLIKKQFLVRSLLNFLDSISAKWLVSESSKLALVVVVPNSIILVQENNYPSRRWTGEEVCTHILTIFDDNKEILVVSDRHESHEYDESAALSGRLPIVDLYDLATTKKRRTGKLSHVCGLSGYGELGDTCPACDGIRSLPHSATKVPY